MLCVWILRSSLCRLVEEGQDMNYVSGVLDPLYEAFLGQFDHVKNASSILGSRL
jgi:hypothetical protein